MYNLLNSPPIVWEKKNAADPDRLVFWLLVEYSFRLKLANPKITIEEFYDKFNKNFFPKFDRPDYYCHDDVFDKIDCDMGYNDYFDYEYAKLSQSAEHHQKYYNILLENGIEF